MSTPNLTPNTPKFTPFSGPASANVYRFEGKEIRVVLDEHDDLWFVASDACRALELAHVASALRVLDDDEKGVRNMHTLGGPQEMGVISEPGLYKLMSRSRKPEAKRLDRWVRHEVLPSIRKTGGYIAAAPDETPEQIMARALIVAQATIDRKTAALALAQPKADALDRISAADGSLNITEAAKALQVRPKDLFVWLSTNGWIYKRAGSDNWLGYQARTQTGDVVHKVSTLHRPDGSEKVTEQVRITAQGLTKLAKLLPGRFTVIDGGQH